MCNGTLFTFGKIAAFGGLEPGSTRSAGYKLPGHYYEWTAPSVFQLKFVSIIVHSLYLEYGYLKAPSY